MIRLLFNLFFSISLLASVSAQPLKVLAYNIHHGRGMDGKVDLERIAKVIAEKSPDLVALQEVDKNVRRSGGVDQAAELAKLLKMDYVFAKAIDLQGGEYGLAVLSKFPLGQSVVHKLPGKGEPRIALEVRTQYQGKELSFVSLHLERNAADARSEQVMAVMKRMGGRDHAVILAGDFNAHREGEPIQQLVKGGWNVLSKNDGNGIRTFHGEKHRKDATLPGRKEIDFVVLKGLKLSSYVHGVIQEFKASDHRPIYAELTTAQK
ncbi:endonuclease/exonuclease/phosphatase family protein [Verrucomicrobiaceae bacterium N1E253]|uniref:Endonuclease/exonuclease/phosphatase family protein n=1 Tax=Oceaniferula marina TaxID=2748318 RepID=A0A851GH99_9BACT|nr:endonuclease/exonuclease/phosphatase family protein [Oceaniferula marina]NWK56736.1 endonuclease/exonuclease/phosphatase family protein [Oceaniferula marina]